MPPLVQGARVLTMDAPYRGGAQRTGDTGAGCLHGAGDLHGGVIDGTRLQMQRGRMG